ncbi:DUF2894 domain-containing protein [Ramlibacter sp. AN1133]|uniref:DUF2894 domain-containing protein n=1 Tax=Ramlibacter sp. AN1133 TaxID=3133429 RepID=UPI0030C0A18F
MSASPAPADRLAALRAAHAWRIDPVRFHAMEALARRLHAQPESVRTLLHEKLAAAVADYEQRVADAPARGAAAAAPAPAPAAAAAAAAVTPFAALHAHLRDLAAARSAAAPPGEIASGHELASARRFRQAWQASRTLQQVEQALERKPANAGPLNSHALVLQSLALMRALSPAYLRRFVGLAETLQWLEAARDPQPWPQPAKTGRTRRRGRSGDNPGA